MLCSASMTCKNRVSHLLLLSTTTSAVDGIRLSLLHKNTGLIGEKITQRIHQWYVSSIIAPIQSMQIRCPHKNTRAAFSDFFPPWEQVLKKCVFRIHVDKRPKGCKTCAFTHRSVFMWMASLTRVKNQLSSASQRTCIRWNRVVCFTIICWKWNLLLTCSEQFSDPSPPHISHIQCHSLPSNTHWPATCYSRLQVL